MLKFAISGEEVKSKYVNVGLWLLRVFTGLALAFGHGIKKVPVSDRFIESVGNLGFPFPAFFAWSAGMAELAGGLLLAVGLFTRPTALFVAITMATAAFVRHGGDSFGDKEKALLFLFVSLLFVFTGSGKYGIDSILIKKKKNQELPI